MCVYIRHTHKIKRTYKFVKGVVLIYFRQLQEIVKMKTYAIALMVIACCVAVIAALIILRRLCNSGRKKKETTQNPVSIAPRETTPAAPPVTVPPPQRTHVDVEKGERKPKSSGTKNGGMVIMGGQTFSRVDLGCGGGC